MPPRPDRSATARSSSPQSSRRCASAPAKPTPTHSNQAEPGGFTMIKAFSRATAAIAAVAASLWTTPLYAQAPAKIDGGDTAWMIAATALVLMMTIPGLALFYSGMVRKKNVLATMAQSLFCAMLCSVIWAVVGYTLVFGNQAPFIG